MSVALCAAQYRVKDGTIDIAHMAVSLLGTIQPDRLNRLILSGDNDGLACRFLYAWPEARAKKRPASKPDLDVLVTAFKRLGLLGSAVLPVSDEGSAAFEAWWTGVHDAATKAATGMLAEAYGKMNGGVLRIALVFEYLAWASADHGTNVEPRHVDDEPTGGSELSQAHPPLLLHALTSAPPPLPRQATQRRDAHELCSLRFTQ